MDFLNYREVDILSDFPAFSFTVYSNWNVEIVRGCVSLKKNSQGKAVEVTVNSKEKNSEDFRLEFVQEFGVRVALIRSLFHSSQL